MKQMIAISLVLVLLAYGALAEVRDLGNGSAAVSFEDGTVWSGFVIGGDSVEAEEDPPKQFVLRAVRPGESIVRFTDDAMRERLLLAIVDEDLHLYVTDVTDTSELVGTVSEIDADARTAVLMTEKSEAVIACFGEADALPVWGERIRVYTDGTMSMSEPAQIGVIGWESIPGDMAR